MHTIHTRPMSVNRCWQGRRFKTKEYIRYERDVYYSLPETQIPDGALSLYIEVGLSNRGGDLENTFKPFIDILSKRYGFNDNRIYELHATKHKVGKGEEYIAFAFTQTA